MEPAPGDRGGSCFWRCPVGAVWIVTPGVGRGPLPGRVGEIPACAGMTGGWVGDSVCVPPRWCEQRIQLHRKGRRFPLGIPLPDPPQPNCHPGLEPGSHTARRHRDPRLRGDDRRRGRGLSRRNVRGQKRASGRTCVRRRSACPLDCPRSIPFVPTVSPALSRGLLPPVAAEIPAFAGMTAGGKRALGQHLHSTRGPCGTNVPEDRVGRQLVD